MRWALRQVNALRQACCEECAAQIAEFALSLPLLVVFIVGIFDFTGALTLKQKLTNAVRDAARVAAADPANDLSNGSKAALPVSVSDAFQVAVNYLQSENINPCGLASAAPTQSNLAWTYAPTGSTCPGNLTLTIDRGCYTSQSIGGVNTDVISTCVSMQYPYKWQFGRVAALVGQKFIGPTTISASATAFNEN